MTSQIFSSSVHPSVPPHLGNIVHEVHARLVGLGVGQLEQRGHPEANGIGTVTTLKNILFEWSIRQYNKCRAKKAAT